MVATPHHATSLPLETRWVMYAHASSARGSYKNDYVTVGSFDNVQDFWRLVQNVPGVASLAGNGHAVLHQRRHVVGAFSLFRDGIAPEWEDEQNVRGGEWYCRFPMGTPSSCLEQAWLDVMLALVGEQWQHCTGARIVNRQVGNKITQKLEVWFREQVGYDTLRAREVLPTLAGDEDGDNHGWVWMKHNS